MRKFQEANDSVTIEQEQADQVRRTVGATLAARALEQVLPAIAAGYGPNMHARVAERMVRDMDKPKHTPGPCWVERRVSRDGIVTQEIKSKSGTLGYTAFGNVDETECAANAQLWASAVDMHKELSSIAGVLDADWPEDQDDGPRAMLLYCINRARAALAAARGEGRGG